MLSFVENTIPSVFIFLESEQQTQVANLGKIETEVWRLKLIYMRLIDLLRLDAFIEVHVYFFIFIASRPYLDSLISRLRIKAYL